MATAKHTSRKRASALSSAGPMTQHSSSTGPTRRSHMPDYTPDEVIERALSRRGFMGALGAAAFLAACGGTTTAKKAGGGGSATTAAKKAAPSGTLLYYNWADYVNPKTYPAFTKATGVKVQKDFFKSNEELQAKLQAGAKGYDLAAPTGYMVQILGDAGMLEPIDYTLLPNVTKN